MTIETRPTPVVHPGVLPRLETVSAMLARAINGERDPHLTMVSAVVYVDQAIRILQGGDA